MNLTTEAAKSFLSKLSEDSKREIIKSLFDDLSDIDKVSVFEHVTEMARIVPVPTYFDYLMVDMKTLDRFNFQVAPVRLLQQAHIENIYFDNVVFVDNGPENVIWETVINDFEQINFGNPMFNENDVDLVEHSDGREIQEQTEKRGFKGICLNNSYKFDLTQIDRICQIIGMTIETFLVNAEWEEEALLDWIREGKKYINVMQLKVKGETKNLVHVRIVGPKE